MHRPSLLLRKQSMRGLSTVEILVAIVFLVFGLLGVLNIVDINQKNNQKASNRAVAIKLAKMKAAEFQAAGYKALDKKLGKNDEVIVFPPGEDDKDMSQLFSDSLKTIDNETKLHFVKLEIKWNASLKRISDSRIEYTVKAIWGSVNKPKGEDADLIKFPPTQNVTFTGFVDAGGAK